MLFSIARFTGQTNVNSRLGIVYQYSATKYEAVKFYLS